MIATYVIAPRSSRLLTLARKSFPVANDAADKPHFHGARRGGMLSRSHPSSDEGLAFPRESMRRRSSTIARQHGPAEFNELVARGNRRLSNLQARKRGRISACVTSDILLGGLEIGSEKRHCFRSRILCPELRIGRTWHHRQAIS